MNIQSALLLVSVALGLTACGGGSSGGDDASAGVESPGAASPSSLTLGGTQVIEDPSSAYNLPCDSPVIQFVIPVSINSDDQDDFIVHYWCDAEQFGIVRTDPTPDALVALVSQPGDTYQPENLDVFGEAFPKLGGASRKFVRGDLNGDGRADLAFAMNWEDGRSGEDPITNATKPSVLLSEPDGRYSIHRLGSPDWGHAVEMVDNESGGKDVVFEGFVHAVGAQAFRYGDDGWEDVSDAYQDNSPGNSWATSFRALPAAPGETAQFLVGAAAKPDGSGSGLELFSRTDDGNWEVTDDWFLDVEFTVDWITWQKTEGTVDVIRLDGQQYFSGAVDDLCFMSINPEAANPMVVAKISAEEYMDGDVIYEDVVYEQSVNTRPVNIMAFFELDGGKLVEKVSPLVGEESNNNFNFFDCQDVNGDGYADLTVFPFSQPWLGRRIEEAGKPIFYINDRQGNLVNLDISEIPGHSAGDSGSQSAGFQGIAHDVNNDGYIDLVLFGQNASGESGNIEIQLILDHLRL